jgi:hypothetical protein
MTDIPIRIGLCTDPSGPYEEVDANAGAEAIRMAIEERKIIFDNTYYVNYAQCARY